MRCGEWRFDGGPDQEGDPRSDRQKLAGWGGFMPFSSFLGLSYARFGLSWNLPVLLHCMQEIVGDIHLEVIDIHPGVIQLDHQMTHG